MKLKAARDVLNWKGEHAVEVSEIDAEAGNFDPARIVKRVVETGDFEFDADTLPNPIFNQNAIYELACSFSGGKKFLPDASNLYGTVRMIASEFIPLGFQYVEYARSGKTKNWMKTKSDMIPETGVNHVR